MKSNLSVRVNFLSIMVFDLLLLWLLRARPVFLVGSGLHLTSYGICENRLVLYVEDTIKSQHSSI